MRSRSRVASVLVVLFVAIAAPLALGARTPASATIIPLTYTNLVGLPEGTITFGTVNTDSGSSLTWTLNSFTSGGVTYNATGFGRLCWDNTGTPTATTCDGFGKFNQGTDEFAFATPVTIATTDTAGGYAAHVKWTSVNGECTGFIGSFPGGQGQFTSGGDSANGCAAISAVPEPGTVVLMLTGLPALSVLVARRRSRFFGAPA